MSASALASAAMNTPGTEDQEELTAAERRFRTDPLTGLFDRSWFESALPREAARCLRIRSPLSLLLVDVDHLASVNEQWGPVAGDLILYRISRAVRLSVRSSDIACRYSDDAFAVIMPGVGAAVAREVASRIVTLLRAFRTSAPVPGSAFEVSASLGVAELSPLALMSHGQLLAAAVRALDVAKRCGGDCVVSGLEP